MNFKDLPQFIKMLDQTKQLTTIDVQVDPELEITEIADRVSKNYGNALLFKDVKGSNYPLIINTLGTYKRLNLGLGVDHLDTIAAQIEDYMNLSSYASMTDKIKALPKLAPLPFIFPRKVKHAPCQEVIEDPDLNTLPILKCWPGDGGKYITLPLVFTKDPETHQQNVGMYRLQVYDKNTTGMHWHLHKDGKEIYEKYRKLGKKMPVSVALGCDPATIYAATAPLPKMIDEMIFAGYLRKKGVDLVKSITSDIYVPAHAEFILEGYVDLDEKRLEGPFGDHTGYYSLADYYPVFHIEKISRKKNPVYPTTIVGKPPMEDCYLGKATERIFLPLLKIQCPELVDMDFPLEGVFHNCAIVSIKKAFPLHGSKTLNSLWGLGQMMYTKMIIVVDSSVNVHDYGAVLKSILENVTTSHHLVINEGPLDALDHASNRAFQGFRLGIDASIKQSVESQGPSLSPQAIEDALKSLTSHKLDSKTIKILPLTKSIGDEGKAVMKAHLNTGLRFLVLVDDFIHPEDLSSVSWKIFNNIDPMRDLFISSNDDGSLYVAIDASKKGPIDGLFRPWPDDIDMTKEMKDYVSKRWHTYGI